MLDFIIGYFKIFTTVIGISIIVLFLFVLVLYYLQKTELSMNIKTIEGFFSAEKQCLNKNPTNADLRNFTKLMGNEFDQMDFKLGYMENIFEKIQADFLEQQKDVDASDNLTRQVNKQARTESLQTISSASNSHLSDSEQKKMMTSRDSTQARNAVGAHGNLSSKQKRMNSLKGASHGISNRGSSNKLVKTQQNMASKQEVVVRAPGGETNKTNKKAEKLLNTVCDYATKKKCPDWVDSQTGELKHYKNNKPGCIKARLDYHINNPDDSTYAGFTYENTGHGSCPSDTKLLNDHVSKAVSNH